MRFMFTEEELKQLDGLPGEDEEVEEEARARMREPRTVPESQNRARPRDRSQTS